VRFCSAGWSREGETNVCVEYALVNSKKIVQLRKIFFVRFSGSNHRKALFCRPSRKIFTNSKDVARERGLTGQINFHRKIRSRFFYSKGRQGKDTGRQKEPRSTMHGSVVLCFVGRASSLLLRSLQPSELRSRSASCGHDGLVQESETPPWSA